MSPKQMTPFPSNRFTAKWAQVQQNIALLWRRSARKQCILYAMPIPLTVGASFSLRTRRRLNSYIHLCCARGTIYRHVHRPIAQSRFLHRHSCHISNVSSILTSVFFCFIAQNRGLHEKTIHISEENINLINRWRHFGRYGLFLLIWYYEKMQKILLYNFCNNSLM